MTTEKEKRMTTETSRVEVITPELAQAWLEKTINVNNRTVADRRVESLMAEMKAGRWRVLGQGITFDTNGHLVDGQHRLWAVFNSGCTVRMSVVRGADPITRAMVDKNRPRSLADDFRLLGDDTRAGHAQVLSGVLTMIDLLEYGTRRSVSHGHAESVYKRHMAGVDWAIHFFPSRRRLDMTSIVGSFAYAYPTAPERVAEFARRYKEGESAGSKDPAFLLRRYVVEAPPGRREDRRIIGLKALRAVMAYLHGEAIASLMATTQGLEYFAKFHNKSGVKRRSGGSP
jgi:hypothetical protein